MLKAIWKTLGRGLSAVGAIATLILMLPLTFAAMVIMLLAGALAMANLRQRARQADRQGATTEEYDRATLRKPPIEGSYTVLRE